MTAPLEGLVVADFSRVLAGPYASMFLADLGATVIKIERTGSGDDTRAWGPPWAEINSAYFESVNRSKLSVCVDLNDPQDLMLVHNIASRADVLIENFKTGTMSRFGLDYHSLHAVNPRLVYASLTGFGSGAGANLPGYDFVVQAVGGLMSITGPVDGGPHKVGVALVDVLTGKDAAIGILAALRAREISGTGQRVEVNLLSSLLGSLVNQASGYLTTGVSPQRMGNEHPSIAPYETLQCADASLVLACGNDAQFARLAHVLGAPELATDERFLTNTKRVAHRRALVALLEARTIEKPASYWENALTEAGIAAGLVGDVASAMARAQALGLEPTYDAGPGHPPQVRNPVTFSDHRPRRDMPPPALGQHDQTIREWYGPLATSAHTQEIAQ